MMANFSLLKDAGVRMAVLEEKLNVYEELSREMLSKLESAVDKISEANQNVAKILVRHEERLDQTLQSDAAIMKLLEGMKDQNKEDKKAMDDKISTLETSIKSAHDKIADMSKYRWVFSGVLLLAMFLISESNVIGDFFNRPTAPAPAIAK
jgi:Mg2+ and Co2+ transporter CorA